MKRHAVTTLFLLAVLTSCHANRNAEILAGSPTKEGTPDAAVFEPNGKELFVFADLGNPSEKEGYSGFCSGMESSTCFSQTLPYEKYRAMKGYFESSQPAKTDSQGFDFYPVVLENGERLVFRSYAKAGNKYKSTSSILPLKLYQEVKAFSPEPVVPGAKTLLTSVSGAYGSKSFKLSNGNGLSEDQLSLIREVYRRFGNNPEVAELLLGMDIERDTVEYRFFITPKGDTLRSGALLYIGFNKGDLWLRFKVKYYGSDWLFVNSFKVAADDYRWQSPALSFERDHSSGDVWEWVDLTASSKHIEAAKALARAQTATIRFQGDPYYADEQLADDQKRSLSDMLKLFELMKRGAPSKRG